MEAIGIAASIIQVAGAGLTLSQVLYNYCDAVSSSRSRIRAIAFYIQHTAVVIQEVSDVFQDENHKHLVSQRAIQTAAAIVAECSRIFESLHEVVEGMGKQRGRIFFPLKEGRLNLIQTELERLKSGLQCMMQVIIYARLKMGSTALNEPNLTDQRKLVEKRLEQSHEAEKKYQQAKSQCTARDSDLDTIPGNAEPSSSNLDATRGILEADQPQHNTLALAAVPTSAQADESAAPKPSRKSSTDRQPGQNTTNYTVGVSKESSFLSLYTSALSLVCCPCLVKAKKESTFPPPSAGNLIPPSYAPFPGHPKRPVVASERPEADRPELRQPDFPTPPPPPHPEAYIPTVPHSHFQGIPIWIPLQECSESDRRVPEVPGVLQFESEARDRDESALNHFRSAPMRAPYEEFETENPEVKRLLRLWTTVYQ